MKKLNHVLVALLLTIVFLSYGLCAIFVTPHVATSAPKSEVKLPIIMYHLILDDNLKLGKFIVSPEIFKNDMDYLINNGYTPISFSNLKEYVYENKPLPQKPIMITFDDGYYNNFLYAYPIIKERNIKIVLSVIGKYAQKYSEINDTNPSYAHCSWDVLSTMQKSGLVEVQNHSFDLHSYNNVRKGALKLKSESADEYKKVLYADFVNNHKMIETKVGKVPEVFTYPFGLVSKEAQQVIKDIGYIGSFICEEGINTITNNPECLYNLKRYNRDANFSSESFFEEKVGLEK